MENLSNSFINFESGGTLQYFEHTYNLWESSAYYNTNDLSPKNLLNKTGASNYNSLFSDDTEVVRDAKNRRIISKESLYQNHKEFVKPQ
jgi:hypothetical protein